MEGAQAEDWLRELTQRFALDGTLETLPSASVEGLKPGLFVVVRARRGTCGVSYATSTLRGLS